MPPARSRFCILLACLFHCLTALAGVEVEGVRGDLRDNVLAHLALDDLPCDAPGWRVRRLGRQAEAQVGDALEAYGYYNPRIVVDSGGDADCWVTRILIEPGERVRLRTVDIVIAGEAAGSAAFGKLTRKPPLVAGAPLDHAAYERYKRSIMDLARQQGYFAAAFETSRIEVFTRENAADVILRFNSGPRFRYGPVSFEQSVVRPELAQRFVRFRPGDPYDGLEVSSFYNALLGTGYFASVDLRAVPGRPPDLEVPITVQMTPAKRKVYTAGIGYGTDTGVKLRGGYTNRRLNDRGHQFDASFNLSEVLSQVGVSYRMPRKDPRVEWLNVDAGYQNEDTSSSQSEIYKIGLKEFHRRPHDWIETWFVDLSTERFEIAGDRQRELLLIPGISWSHSFPDTAAVTRPERGHRLVMKISGTTEKIGSDSEFLQTDVYGKLIWPLWREARVLMRAEVGATVKDEFRTLPASVRYFAGGDYSVRGYDYKTLGPTDDAGNVIGGSHKLVGSVELDQRVLPNWSLAAFFDTGNSFDSFSSLRTKSGAGGGVRWYSPLGPVRLDLAFPLDKDAPDDWRIHVTLGPDL